MLDYDELGEAIIAVIGKNHEFIQAMGPGELDLSYFKHTYPEKTATGNVIEQMQAPAALLTWNSTQLIERSNGIIHSFSLFVMPRGPSGKVLKALRDGVVYGGTGLPLKFYQFQPEGHAIDVTGSQLRPIVISQTAIFELTEIFLQVTETGADN